jgi:TolB protein
VNAKIAFARTSNFVYGRSDIYVMNPDGSGQTNLTRDSSSNWNGWDGPAWSPDGKQIAMFGETISTMGNGQIYIMNADGWNKREVSPARPSKFRTHPARYQTDGYPAWSATGTIALDSDRNACFPGDHSFTNTCTEIYVMNANGSGFRRLTDERHEFGPGYPHGRRTAR